MKTKITKLAVILLANLLVSSSIYAQFDKMSYQAVIRNSSDALLINTQIGIKISILQGTTTGTVVYDESQEPSTNDNGLISIEFGDAMDFSSIDWANGPYFIKTEIDPAGGTAYSITGISQLLSVPFALHANTAEFLTNDIAETDPVYEASQAANITSTDITHLNNLSGTNTGDQTLVSILTENTSAGGNKITNLADPTTEQDAATKAYVDVLEQQIAQMQNAMMTTGSIAIDYDGNIYGVVTIGTQKWMAENLKTTHFANGDEISDGTGLGDYSELYYPIYWFAYDDDLNNVSTYGRLYTWATVNDGRNICPDGWHVPSDAEWTTLTDYLGGEDIAGGKLREAGTEHWETPNTGASNESGFTALPGGVRSSHGSFSSFGNYCYWWSSTENDAMFAEKRHLGNSTSKIYGGNYVKQTGLSVRCLKD